MVTSLLKYERIQTTDTKAKELKRWADSIITLAKRGDVHARRQALAIVREKEVVNKLFAEAAERFASKAGGYTRILKVGRRPGDAAPVSLIELTGEAKSKEKKPAKKKATKAAKSKTTKGRPAKAEKEQKPAKEAAPATSAPETQAALATSEAAEPEAASQPADSVEKIEDASPGDEEVKPS